jgi:hypothetical protein
MMKIIGQYSIADVLRLGTSHAPKGRSADRRNSSGKLMSAAFCRKPLRPFENKKLRRNVHGNFRSGENP